MELRIVYAGAPGSGKTTNLDVIRSVISGSGLSDVVKTCVSSIGKSPLDILYFEIERKGAERLGFRISTLPYVEDYKYLWKMILEGCHGIVVVIDSQLEKVEDNQACIRKIIDHLSAPKEHSTPHPIFFQYNKRDLPGALLPEDLDDKLGPGAERSMLASAIRGEGVLATLMEMSRRILEYKNVSAARLKKLEEGLV